MRLYTGTLSKLPDNVHVFSSQLHSRDSYPRYFSTSDMSLISSQALNGYLKRWSCEVANWYIAERLGWVDCRLWSVDSVKKYLLVLYLVLAFLEYLQASEYPGLNLAEIIEIAIQMEAWALRSDGERASSSARLVRYATTTSSGARSIMVRCTGQAAR